MPSKTSASLTYVSPEVIEKVSYDIIHMGTRTVKLSRFLPEPWLRSNYKVYRRSSLARLFGTTVIYESCCMNSRRISRSRSDRHRNIGNSYPCNLSTNKILAVSQKVVSRQLYIKVVVCIPLYLYVKTYHNCNYHYIIYY